MFDIRNYEETCNTINAILNNKGVCEVHNEIRKDENGNVVRTVVVVEQKRTVKSREK